MNDCGLLCFKDERCWSLVAYRSLSLFFLEDSKIKRPHRPIHFSRSTHCKLKIYMLKRMEHVIDKQLGLSRMGIV